MILEYNRKIYSALFFIIPLFQTRKLELSKTQWIICYGLIAILGEGSVIISATTAKDTFNLIQNAAITNVSLHRPQLMDMKFNR